MCIQFVIGSVVSAILGLAGLAYTLNHGIYKSDLTPWLEERFFVLFHEMDYNERSARIMRIIQEDVIHNKYYQFNSEYYCRKLFSRLNVAVLRIGQTIKHSIKSFRMNAAIHRQEILPEVVVRKNSLDGWNLKPVGSLASLYFSLSFRFLFNHNFEFISKILKNKLIVDRHIHWFVAKKSHFARHSQG